MTRRGRWLAALAVALAGTSVYLSTKKQTARERIVAAIRSEMAAYGQHPRVPEYWRVSGASPNTKEAWCGAFALWALRTAGVKAPDWIFGEGFVSAAHLPLTRNPQPGDIVYQDQPWQHYGVVEYVDAAGVHTIEGNTPGITEHVHALGDPKRVYYSIAPLVGA